MGADSGTVVALETGRGTSLGWPRILTPSLADLFLLAMIWWLFLAGPYGWSSLLADGDTGWHIRVGEHILDSGRIPRQDLFSFSKPGETWYAWEWLADVAFALAHRQAGLKGVVLLSGVLISALALLLVRFATAKSGNFLLALPLCLLAVGASSIHFLARPHVFTLVLFAASLWLLDRDRERPTRWVWTLIPLTALWVNLHGGFLALPAMLVAALAGTAAEWALGARGRAEALAGLRRQGLLLAGCAAASLANPFGLGYYRHLAGYLASDWIKKVVDEFQSPKFRNEAMLQYEILLVLGLGTAALLVSRKRVTEALWILLWAHASLTSVRHVPLFVIVAAPLVAGELALWLRRVAGAGPKPSLVAVLRSLGEDLAPAFRRNSVWVVLPWLALAWLDAPLAWPRDFPEQLFPTEMVHRHAERLVNGRLFTTDEWADYLIYRHYPRQRVFIDGRSDFYGPELGNDYFGILNGRHDWARLMDRYGFDTALVGTASPVATLLKLDPRWRIAEDDGRAILFTRRAAPDPGGH